MIYAQILNGTVINVIVLADEDLIDTFSEGFDHFVEIEQVPGSPGVGWSYDGTDFSPPEPLSSYEQKVLLLQDLATKGILTQEQVDVLISELGN